MPTLNVGDVGVQGNPVDCKTTKRLGMDERKGNNTKIKKDGKKLEISKFVKLAWPELWNVNIVGALAYGLLGVS